MLPTVHLVFLHFLGLQTPAEGGYEEQEQSEKIPQIRIIH